MFMQMTSSFHMAWNPVEAVNNQCVKVQFVDLFRHSLFHVSLTTRRKSIHLSTMWVQDPEEHQNQVPLPSNNLQFVQVL